MESTSIPTHCDRCHEPIVASGIGTGYGRSAEGAVHCYACCGLLDSERLASLDVGERFDGLYLSETGETETTPAGNPIGKRYQVTNWPGTLKIQVGTIRSSWHNFAGEGGRRDFWFCYRGNQYHGVNIGWAENCRVRRIKGD